MHKILTNTIFFLFLIMTLKEKLLNKLKLIKFKMKILIN